MQRFPVIVGPTAGGKSALALALARELARASACACAAEIVSADAFQIYRGMDIGTAKPSPEEQALAPHHCIDIVEPSAAFSVERWLERAHSAIAAITRSSRTPIVVGGTLLYVMALLEGLFEGPGADDVFRAQARERRTEELAAELARVDPATARKLHPNDRKRIIRALEVHRLTGKPLTTLQSQWDRNSRRADALLVVLDWPRDVINRRINARVKAMADAGLVDEVRSLLAANALGAQAREAIGYRQLADALDQRRPLDDAFEQIKVETRRFAKRQRSWIRRLLAGSPEGSALVIDAHATPFERWPTLVLNALEQSSAPPVPAAPA